MLHMRVVYMYVCGHMFHVYVMPVVLPGPRPVSRRACALQRPSKVTVKAVDLKGRPLTLKLDKFPARIFQHEYDHLQVGPAVAALPDPASEC